MTRKSRGSGVETWCSLCNRLIGGSTEVARRRTRMPAVEEEVSLLRDRRTVHWQCVLKAGLDPLDWIHAHGSPIEMARWLAEHPRGYAYPPDHPSADRPPLEPDPSMGKGI
jgi:hypothetical protein